MTGIDHTGLAPLESDLLARLAQEQLAREGALLDASLDDLRQVWSALLANDQPALQDVLGRQTDQEPCREELLRQRTYFRQRAAALLGVAPGEVHLGLVLDNLRGGSADRLEQERGCLRQKVQEAVQLRAHVATLTSHCLSFLNRLFLDFTGAAGGQYSSAGSNPETASGLLLELRG